MTYTLIIVIITVLISLAAFSNETVYSKLILWPRQMQGNPAEYYRLLTSGFIHADWGHLFFNMFALYSFGQNVELLFHYLRASQALYLLLYLSAIVIASLPSFLKNRNDGGYRSLGASGGVAAIIFFTIYFSPWSSNIQLMFIPYGIPSIVFGILYLIYEAYMARRGRGNINHSAHIFGSIYGFVFAFLVDPTHGQLFVEQLMNYTNR